MTPELVSILGALVSLAMTLVTGALAWARRREDRLRVETETEAQTTAALIEELRASRAREQRLVAAMASGVARKLPADDTGRHDLGVISETLSDPPPAPTRRLPPAAGLRAPQRGTDDDV